MKTRGLAVGNREEHFGNTLRFRCNSANFGWEFWNRCHNITEIAAFLRFFGNFRPVSTFSHKIVLRCAQKLTEGG